MLTIWVHFGLEAEYPAGSVVADTLAALLHNQLGGITVITRVGKLDFDCFAIKDGDNNFHPLKNAELVLEGELQPDKEGYLNVYVQVPEVVETARPLSGSLKKKISTRFNNKFLTCVFFLKAQEAFRSVRESGFRAQFLALLKRRPNTNRLVISDAAWERLTMLHGWQALFALDGQDVAHAHEIFRSANAVLSNATVRAVYDATGTTIFPEPLESSYESSSSFFYRATNSSGVPLVFKIPRPFAREIAVCRELALEREHKAPGIMRISVQQFEVRGEEARHETEEGGEEESRQVVEALVMPAMHGSLLKLGYSAALLRRSESIVAGLNWLHERGYVHMDVKQGNIFVEATTGDWFLGDFGTCVRVGERVQGTTVWCYPKPINGTPSQFAFDWYMLAVALLVHEYSSDRFPRTKVIQAWTADEDEEIPMVDDAKI